jgi:hypothetical protein
MTCYCLLIISGNIFLNLSFYGTSNLNILRKKTTFLIHIKFLITCTLVSILTMNIVLWLIDLRSFDATTFSRSFGKRLHTGAAVYRRRRDTLDTPLRKKKHLKALGFGAGHINIKYLARGIWNVLVLEMCISDT